MAARHSRRSATFRLQAKVVESGAPRPIEVQVSVLAWQSAFLPDSKCLARSHPLVVAGWHKLCCTLLQSRSG
jgi:hypothetical protein